MGGSAGAGSVGLHLTAYGGRDDGLFVGAFGDAFFYPTSNNQTFSQYQYDQFATSAGCGSASDTLACLRSAPVEALLTAADINNAYPGQALSSRYIWTPVVNDDFIQALPLQLYQNGQFVRVPLIVGDVLDEGTVFANDALDAAGVSAFMSANYPLLSSSNLTTINELYPPTTVFPLRNLYYSSSAAAYGEATFKCPGYLIGSSMAAAGLTSQVWQYNFTQSVPIIVAAGFGVAHNSDLGALFGGSAGNSTGFFDIEDNITNAVLYQSFGNINILSSTIEMSYLISFIRSLDPNAFKASVAPQWDPTFASGTPQQVQIQNVGSQMQPIDPGLISRCHFWWDLIEQIRQ